MVITRAPLLVVLACSACTSGSGAQKGTDGQLCTRYTMCVQSGSSYNCDCGGGTWQACEGSNSGQCPPGSVSPCMGCSQGANYTCGCLDDGGRAARDGGTWECVGGGNACR